MSKLVDVTSEGNKLVMHLDCGHTKSIEFNVCLSPILVCSLRKGIGREEYCPACIKVYYCKSCNVAHYITVTHDESFSDILIRLHDDHKKLSPECHDMTRAMVILDTESCPTLDTLIIKYDVPYSAIGPIARFLSIG